MRTSNPRAALLSRDTDAAAEEIQLSLWRRMPAGKKLCAAANATTAALRMALAGVQMRSPGAGAGRAFFALAGWKLGDDLARRIYGSGTPPDGSDAARIDPVTVAVCVAGVLNRCGIRYVVGGSLASSVSGEPRSTLDVDIMVDMPSSAVRCVVDGLGEEFHADADAFARAIRDRSSVNIIHLPTATKVDLFVMGATPIEPRQMDRRRRIEIADPPGTELYVYTPEDILLQKLRCYRLGGEVSDRQWRDILGIIVVQRGGLDVNYLRNGAAEIDVAALLERALVEAGGTG